MDNRQITKFVESYREQPKPDSKLVDGVLRVAPTIQQEIVVRSNYVDRANANLKNGIPFYFMFGFTVTAITVWATILPLLSLGAVVVFSISSTLIWLIRDTVWLMISAEGTAFIEMLLRWWVIIREQDRMWDYYKGKGKK